MFHCLTVTIKVVKIRLVASWGFLAPSRGQRTLTEAVMMREAKEGFHDLDGL